MKRRRPSPATSPRQINEDASGSAPRRSSNIVEDNKDGTGIDPSPVRIRNENPPKKRVKQGPPKFYLSLKQRPEEWAKKDRRDGYRLAISKALEDGRKQVPAIDLKCSWSKYYLKHQTSDAETFEGVFREKLAEYLKYLPSQVF